VTNSQENESPGMPIAPNLEGKDTWGFAYESTLTPQEKGERGQFFTPSFLCDLLLVLGIQAPLINQKDWHLLEPSFGTGAILERAYEYLNYLGISSPQERCSKLFGIEKDLKAVDLTHKRFKQLMKRDLPQKPIFKIPTLCYGDFLDPFPPHFPTLGYNSIIGNPPYVRQEVWEKMYLSKIRDEKAPPQNEINLANPIHLDSIVSPTAQDFRSTLQDHFYPDKPVQSGILDSIFDSSNDLSIWFCIKSLAHLKPGGRLSFVISNSWLNTGFGEKFQQFLTLHCQNIYIIESTCEAWFQKAAINPVILVLVKRESPLTPASETKATPEFIRFLWPISDILETILETEAETQQYNSQMAQWKAYQKMVEHIFTPPHCSSTPTWMEKSSLSSKNREKNVPEETNGGQNIQGSGSTPWNSWSFSLRCPSSLQGVITQPHLQWKALDNLGSLKYALKTGINSFFYLTPQTIEAFGIEPEFLIPVLKSSKEITHLKLNPNTWATQQGISLFSCPYDKDILQKEGKTGALSYIEWGAQQWAPTRQKRLESIPWPQVPSVQGRTHWYGLPLPPAPPIFCSRFFDNRFFFVEGYPGITSDQTFYGFYPFPQKKELRNDVCQYQENQKFQTLLMALLNTTLSYLLLEISGRKSLGDGVLQFSLQDFNRFCILDPAQFSPWEVDAIVESYSVIAQRPLLKIHDELQQPDRHQLDQLILKKLRLQGKTFEAEDLYKGLNTLVTRRKTMAKNRRNEH
jgi:type I restriction enzyme M protein